MPPYGGLDDHRQLGRRLPESQINAYPSPTRLCIRSRSDLGRKLGNEAVAKLRAMNEAGNITWDLVDVVAADAIRLCDEGLAMEYRS
jgi:putative spermidine/putrescine transport system substrate-binding protein